MASRNATRDIRTRLIIEGEDEYKAALKSNADEAKELQSEMDLLTAKFEDNADSEDYLAQRTELLARQQENAAERTRIYAEYTESAKDAQERLSAEIDKARTTMSSLQAQIEQATSEYGENSEQVQKLTTQYQQYERAVEQMEKQQQKATSTVTRLRTSTNKAERSQVEFTNAIKKSEKPMKDMEKQQQKATSTVTRLRTSTNKAERSQVEFTNAIKKSEKPMKDYDDATGDAAKGSGLLDSAVNDLAGRFGVDLPESATTALGSIGASAAGISAAIGVVTAAVNAVIEAGKALIDMAAQQAEAATELDKMSAQMGVSTQRLQELQYAATASGVEVDRMVDSTQDLSEALIAAQDPTSDEAKAFRELGVSTRDANGEARSSGDAWEEVIQKLSTVSNRTEQARLGQMLLGEAFYELLPILEDVESFYGKVSEAQELGIARTEDENDALVKLNASFKELGARIDAVKSDIAVEAADELTASSEKLGNAITEIGNYLIESGAVDAFAQFIEYLATMIELLSTLTQIPGIDNFFKSLDIAFTSLTKGLEMVNAAAEKFMSWISKIAEPIADLGFDLARDYGSFSGSLQRGHAAGTPYSPGGVVRVGEYGPEMVYLPKGSRVVNATDTAAQQESVVNITINANVPDLGTLQNIIEFYKNYQLTRRKG